MNVTIEPAMNNLCGGGGLILSWNVVIQPLTAFHEAALHCNRIFKIGKSCAWKLLANLGCQGCINIARGKMSGGGEGGGGGDSCTSEDGAWKEL